MLEQTYQDFEIVISDDTSPDDTIPLLLKYLSEYQGAIPIRLYRSAQNKGLLLNRLTAMNYARGTLFVNADGDDFSMPQRLEKIVNAWNSFPQKPSILATNALMWCEQTNLIGPPENNNVTEGFYPPGDPVCGKTMMFGAGFVVTRDLFETFKEIIPEVNIICEDVIFARRAALRHGLIFRSEPIFYYSVSTTSASGGGVEGRKWIEERKNQYNLLLRDITHITPNHKVPVKWRYQIQHERKKWIIDAMGRDCPLWEWPLYWVAMCFLSPRWTIAMLKKRIKLIILGSVDATWSKN
ncbi:MAG: glycosyltransferase family 2 protein [Kiritimatiellia bacterium]